jgi:hypothetical protein
MLPTLASYVKPTHNVAIHVPFASSQVPLAPVLIAKQMDCVILFSSSTEQVQRHALFATLASCAGPVVHFYRVDQSDVAEAVAVPNLSLIGDYITSSCNKDQAGEDLASKKEQKIKELISVSQKLIGAPVKAFEFVGKPSKNVIVTLGSVLSDEQLKVHLVNTIQINIFNPWNTADFINLLPSNLENILLIEDKSLASTWDPLYLAVVYSIISSGILQPTISFLDTTPFDLKFQESLTLTNEPSITNAEENYFVNLLSSTFGDALHAYSAETIGSAEIALGIRH